MSEKDDEEILESVKSSVDFSIVTDNILGIADFVIEKYEFKNDCTLTEGQREEATAKIKEALWAQVEELKPGAKSRNSWQEKRSVRKCPCLSDERY